MRVLLVHRDYAPARGGGGVARHMHGLARELAARGVDVAVASRQTPMSDENSHTAAQVSFVALPAHVRAADVVHLHGARSLYTAFAALCCVMAGKPYVYTPHCYYPSATVLKASAKNVWDRLIERPLMRRAARSLALSEDWRAYMDAAFGPARLAVVPNCVRMADLAEASGVIALAGAPAILSVGRLDPVKRIDDIVRALARPGMERAVLHIVGRGPDEARLAKVARECGVAQRVAFHGFVDDAAVAAMLRAASVFVLASAIEGLPTVLMEALLRGCSVAASDIPGNRGVLDPLALDALFPVGDVDAMSRAIRRAAAQPLAPHAATRAEALFSWERNVERILRIYDEAVRGA